MDNKTLLNRGTVDVIVKKELEEKLKSGKKLNIKLGIDPSGSDLHLGHMVVIKKLREFQLAGHNVILLFGNFTGQIGDPTDKKSVRQIKTQEELEKNAAKYLEQVSKVLDTDKVEVRWNADWLNKLNFTDVVKLSSCFTVSQMLERDMFQERIKNEKAIHMQEFLYPLMQGYDSYALKADVELGGTDQTFNMLAGRTIQKAYGQTPQNVISVPLLIGTDGSEKMGKSLGNYIGVKESAKDMYGKVMSIKDELILDYFELATNISLKEIGEIKEKLENGTNPRDLKMHLAKNIVTIYHSEEAAKKAEENFLTVFSKKGIPDNIPDKEFKKDQIPLIELIALCNFSSSNSEARRLIQGGAVKIDQEKIEDIDFVVEITTQKKLLQVGKRKFIHISKC